MCQREVGGVVISREGGDVAGGKRWTIRPKSPAETAFRDVVCVFRGVKWCHSPEPEEIANECRVNQNEGDIQ